MLGLPAGSAGGLLGRLQAIGLVYPDNSTYGGEASYGLTQLAILVLEALRR